MCLHMRKDITKLIIHSGKLNILQPVDLGFFLLLLGLELYLKSCNLLHALLVHVLFNASIQFPGI